MNVPFVYIYVARFGLSTRHPADNFVSFSALILLLDFTLQKLRKEVEESQLKLAEAQAKVQSLESKSGWFERRLAETEVCCCTTTVHEKQISK